MLTKRYFLFIFFLFIFLIVGFVYFNREILAQCSGNALCLEYQGELCLPVGCDPDCIPGSPGCTNPCTSCEPDCPQSQAGYQEVGCGGASCSPQCPAGWGNCGAANNCSSVGETLCGDLSSGCSAGSCPSGEECKAAEGGGCGCTKIPGCSSPTCTGISQAPSCITPGSTFTVKIGGEDAAHGGVEFPTWSDLDGQNDIVWYEGIDEGAGVWRANIPQSSHTGGNINVHVYLVNQCDERTFCDGRNIALSATPTPEPTSPPVSSAPTNLRVTTET